MIGQTIRTLRVQAGLRQQELAEAVGVNRMLISRCENGENITIDNLQAILNHFNKKLIVADDDDDSMIITEKLDRILNSINYRAVRNGGKLGWVYIATKDGKTKIGMSRQDSPEDRMEEGWELWHYILTQDCVALEKDMHAALQEDHLHGEWFSTDKIDAMRVLNKEAFKYFYMTPADQLLQNLVI